MMQTRRQLFLLFPCLLFLISCSTSLYMAPEFRGNLLLVTTDPASYTVKIDYEGTPIKVPPNGQLTLFIPEKKACSSHILGIRISGPKAEKRKSILFIQDGCIVKKMSMAQLKKLPVDASGHRILRF